MFKKVLLGLLAVFLIFSAISCKPNIDIGTNAKTPTWLIGKWVNEEMGFLMMCEFTEISMLDISGHGLSYNVPGVTTKEENNKFLIDVNDVTLTFEKDGEKMKYYVNDLDDFSMTFTRPTT